LRTLKAKSKHAGSQWLQSPAPVIDRAVPACGGSGTFFLPETPAVSSCAFTGRTRRYVYTECLQHRRFVWTAQSVWQPPHLAVAVFLSGCNHGCDIQPQKADVIKARLRRVHRNRTS